MLDGIPEKTVVDTLCITVKKKGWSADDTPKTIQDARAWNRQIDRHCGVADKVAIR